MLAGLCIPVKRAGWSQGASCHNHSSNLLSPTARREPMPPRSAGGRPGSQPLTVAKGDTQQCIKGLAAVHDLQQLAQGIAGAGKVRHKRRLQQLDIAQQATCLAVLQQASECIAEAAEHAGAHRLHGSTVKGQGGGGSQRGGTAKQPPRLACSKRPA